MKSKVESDFIDENHGDFFKVKDGLHLYIYSYKPLANYKSTIFIISGITGINHINEQELILQLSNNENRIVAIHPRGTGLSDGIRGDIYDFKNFINDYVEIIKSDIDYNIEHHKLFLFGHSMSCAVLLAIANILGNISGAILVNPPYIQKKAKGMSPSLSQYMKYAFYYLIAKHKPIVNMAGVPEKIENEEDRKESEQRVNDTMLVKYFSLYYMNESRKLINSMLEFSKKADYPLLLIYGMQDNIVDKKGCDLIYEKWNHENKQYVFVENGSHGKSTIKISKDKIVNWIKNN